jgi:hypothetical protein
MLRLYVLRGVVSILKHISEKKLHLKGRTLSHTQIGL